MKAFSPSQLIPFRLHLIDSSPGTWGVCNCLSNKYLQTWVSLPVLQVIIFSHLLRKTFAKKGIKIINWNQIFSLGFAVNK